MKQENQGHLHPTTQFIRRILGSFEELGFKIAEGPELETEWYCFDFLNMPADHPSRDAQDTFWIAPGKPLRVQTTAVQGRLVNPDSPIKPPLRYIIPGKIYRNEATDATHEAIFHQIDGFVIDRDIKLTDLIGTLENMYKKVLGDEIELRFRPHLFPFVEPGLEVDLKWKGKWMEMLGAGMIHPVVLKNMGLDSKEWQGYAFGIGLDRFLMSYYGIEDIRHLFKNDLRFLEQF